MEHIPYHYQTIRRAIEAIDAADTPLTLDALAEDIGMSAPHFQRTFSKWVGVSPKRYQQYLALDHAKSMLAQNFTTLETAHSIGLSGTSRLYDMFLKWEAMSPGEFAQGGAGLTIMWGWFGTPFGPCVAMGTAKGICGMGFAEAMGDDAALQDLIQRWPNAVFQNDAGPLMPMVEAVFGHGKGEAKLHLIGAPFQIKVWEALLRVPSGHVTTYSEIANSIGSPKAVRAVGTAVGRNPISYLIPCHRALRKSGELGGYHWGLPVKRAMLAFESARLDATG